MTVHALFLTLGSTARARHWTIGQRLKRTALRDFGMKHCSLEFAATSLAQPFMREIYGTNQHWSTMPGLRGLPQVK
jgi:hypothetical protein